MKNTTLLTGLVLGTTFLANPMDANAVTRTHNTESITESEAEGHDDHEGEHSESEEVIVTEISPESADISGIKTKKSASQTLYKTVPIMGRIVLNETQTTNIRARFPGVVTKVFVNLGDRVTKGQKLATIEGNESLKTYTVTAPFEGVILKRNTNIGDVTTDSAMFKMTNLSTVWAKYHIFPKDADKIQKGQKIRIHSLEGGKETEANISMILPTANAYSQTLIAIAEVDNADELWKPGMTVEGNIQIHAKQVNVAVPTTAIQNIDGNDVVFVKTGEDDYTARPVKLGLKDNEFIEVLAGLDAGETYVFEGSFVVKSSILSATASHGH